MPKNNKKLELKPITLKESKRHAVDAEIKLKEFNLEADNTKMKHVNDLYQEPDNEAQNNNENNQDQEKRDQIQFDPKHDQDDDDPEAENEDDLEAENEDDLDDDDQDDEDQQEDDQDDEDQQEDDQDDEDQQEDDQDDDQDDQDDQDEEEETNSKMKRKATRSKTSGKKIKYKPDPSDSEEINVSKRKIQTQEGNAIINKLKKLYKYKIATAGKLNNVLSKVCLTDSSSRNILKL
jgi:hypothetical protein